MKNGIIITIAIIAMATVGLGMYMLFKKKKKEEPEPETKQQTTTPPEEEKGNELIQKQMAQPAKIGTLAMIEAIPLNETRLRKSQQRIQL